MVYCVPDVIQPFLLGRKSEAFFGVTISVAPEAHFKGVRGLTDKPWVDKILAALLDIGGGEAAATLLHKVVDLRLLLRSRESRARPQYVYCLNKTFKGIPVG